MRVAPSHLTLLAIALSLSTLSHAADKVVGPGENADTGSRSVLVPSGVAAGVIDTGSGDVLLEAIVGSQDRRHPALRPVGIGIRRVFLGDHQDAPVLGSLQREVEPGDP